MTDHSEHADDGAQAADTDDGAHADDGEHADRAIVDFERASDFLLRNARLIERRLFAARFRGAPTEGVVTALRAYQNEDGGFGLALEPDLRGPDSQPLHVDMAAKKTAPLAENIMARLARMMAAHARLPIPEAAGRRIAMRKD